MKQQKVLYGIIGLLVGVGGGMFISSYAINTNQSGMMQMMGIRRGAMNSNLNLVDAHFIEQMIPHHEDAITMANLALTKAKHDEIKTLATNIIQSQQKEIDAMKRWYTNWYGTDVPSGNNVMDQHGMMGGNGTSMHMGMMGSENDIQRLEDAADFDKAFIEGMIPHHQMAVMMSSMLKNGTQRSEMKQLADDITTAQTTEIEQMRSWYNEWYK
ncbi:MAG: hypothetical protein RI947_1536 [Candidatus Parcubacteria bacterium]|jgi:uncharacterized protein (DUF305 family)